MRSLRPQKIQHKEKSLIAGNETEARRCLQALGRALAHLKFEGVLRREFVIIRTISRLTGLRDGFRKEARCAAARSSRDSFHPVV